MISFLFWNMRGTGSDDRSESLKRHLIQLVREFQVDVFIFAEPALTLDEFATLLSSAGSGEFRAIPSENSQLHFLARIPRREMIKKHDSADGRFSVKKLFLSDGELLIAAVHVQSRLHWDAQELAFQMTTISNEIKRIEGDERHQRTIVVGDFNQNPFESGLVGSQALHAVPTKQIATAGSRVVAGAEYPYFYNPMWGFFGDRTPGPPGSYFYRSATPLCHFWNTFDQLLVRPAIMEKLADVRILDNDGERSFLSDAGLPNSTQSSDHLPIYFQLDFSFRRARQ